MQLIELYEWVLIVVILLCLLGCIILYCTMKDGSNRNKQTDKLIDKLNNDLERTKRKR